MTWTEQKASDSWPSSTYPPAIDRPLHRHSAPAPVALTAPLALQPLFGSISGPNHALHTGFNTPQHHTLSSAGIAALAISRCYH